MGRPICILTATLAFAALGLLIGCLMMRDAFQVTMLRPDIQSVGGLHVALNYVAAPLLGGFVGFALYAKATKHLGAANV